MSVLDRFKGCAAADANTGRTPKPSLGKAVYLITTVRMKDSTRGNGFRVETKYICLWGISAGQNANGTEEGPNNSGDRVADCIFSGDYFHKSFKEFALKCLGMDQSQELDIVNYLKNDPECAVAFEGCTDDLACIQVMWEKVLPAKICGLKMDGTADAAGVFDGQVVVELGTTEKKSKKKINSQGPNDVSNWVHDNTGKPVETTHQNTYINRKVGKDEIREKLSEEEIARFFGSTDAFEAME
jgi:hypothetical protein